MVHPALDVLEFGVGQPCALPAIVLQALISIKRSMHAVDVE